MCKSDISEAYFLNGGPHEDGNTLTVNEQKEAQTGRPTLLILPGIRISHQLVFQGGGGARPQNRKPRPLAVNKPTASLMHRTPGHFR